MINEEEIMAAFKEEFSPEYLGFMDLKSTPTNNVVELLWMAFARGYTCKDKEAVYEVQYLEEREETYQAQMSTSDYEEAEREMNDMLEGSNIEAVKIIKTYDEEVVKIVKVDSEYT